MQASKKKNLTLLYRNIETEHLGKDVFLVPYYLGKIFNTNTNIVYSRSRTNRNIPETFRNVTLIPYANIFFKKSNEYLRGLWEILYILLHAKKIDVLMRFFFSDISAIVGYLYKKINKTGILYIKCDGKMGEWPLLGYFNSINSKNRNVLIRNIKTGIYTYFLNTIDLITVETKAGYKSFKSNSLLNIDLKDKVKLMYSGFDKDLFEQYNIYRKNYSQKENIIITVGRLGSYPKNTIMLLHAVEKLDFKDWKLILIGPIEKDEGDFQLTIDDFFKLNPVLKDKVIFTGPVYDKKILWELYNNAKIFILTSIYESFGIVLTEALFFKNYIISTDVGSAKDLIEKGYGEIIPQNDNDYLNSKLQEIINKNDLEYKFNNVNWDNNDISWEKFVREATMDLAL
jgi:glycosyltransferase involved in cell wall biosynthesis